jgi:hypothetical protein
VGISLMRHDQVSGFNRALAGTLCLWFCHVLYGQPVRGLPCL